MFKFDDVFSVRALTFFILLMICPLTLETQESSQVPSSAPSQPPVHSFTSDNPPPSDSHSTDAAPALKAPGQPNVTYQDKATPEEIGDSFAAHQRYQEAVEAYLKSPDHSAQLWNKMGISYQMLFDLKDATKCYEASLKMDPHNARVLNNLATVYDSQKIYGKAERLYRKALKYDPHSALILRNLGSNYMAQHKYKKGADAYQAAVAIDPKILEQHTGASVQNPASVKERGALHYYMAKSCVSAGNAQCAIHNLRLALNEGYTNAKKIAEDSGFTPLRESADFQQLIAAQTHQ